MLFAVAIFATLITLFGIGLLSFDLLLFLAFISFLGILIYCDRRKIKLEGIILIRRTAKGRKTIDRIANSHRSFWKFMSIAGIIIAVPALLIISAFLINNSYLLVTKQTEEGAARLLLPAPVASPTSAPGIFFVPWWIWVVGVAVVVVPHELFHGIMCRLEKIRIKSVGWILLLFIPGAFVEPDENQLKKARRLVKLKVYAAGSFANIVVGFTALIVLLFSASSFSQVGSSFLVIKDSPADMANLSGSIAEIDGMKISSLKDLQIALADKKPGDIIVVKALKNKDVVPVFSGVTPKASVIVSGENTYSINLTQRPDNNTRAYFGIDGSSFIPAVTFLPGIQFLFLYHLLFWIFLFSIGIGLVNLLPIKPLDGGLVFEELLGHTKKTKTIVKGISTVMLLLLIFNLVGPFFL
ncbi:MAG: site-2 protease family protein [Candidatus Aenigmarchaeota archaeon]|nr:site-2 protease family protein [Candidatus Aenigmarchaeota archaeon]